MNTCLFISLFLIPWFPNTTASPPPSNLITSKQPLTKSQTLVSPNGIFELGFFSTSPPPPSITHWYVGIWYKSIEQRTFLWVLNRDQPIANSSSPSTILTIDPQDGNLILTDEAQQRIWSTNLSRSSGGDNAVAELLDSGNFVLRPEENDGQQNPAGDYLWQSFDYPTDTLLPGMKLGWDKKSGLNRFLTSWKTSDDPSTGDYSFKMNTNGFPAVYLYHKQTVVYRSGPWNGVSFSGVPEMKPSPFITFGFAMDGEEDYYTFYLNNNSVHSRLTMSHAGSLQRLTWVPTSKIWSLFWYAPKDQCDEYRECGAYGVCDTNASPVCNCMMGFVPRNPQAWNLRDGSDGCVRVGEEECGSDGFLKMSYVKLPESDAAVVDPKMGLDRCRERCRGDCTCRGFSNSNVTGGGSGCVIWTRDLYDMRQYADGQGGQDFYFRVSNADLVKAGAVASPSNDNSSNHSSTHLIKVVIIPVATGIVLASLAILYLRKRAINSRNAVKNITADHRGTRERSQDYLLNAPNILSKRDHNSVDNVVVLSEDFELPLFDLTTLLIATDKFSDANKLGQGGFGIVYKGKFEGEEVAVKRLSKNSGQGIEEFKNEVKLIARLQHRNLVRLLGCCVEMDEKILIYEYMENKSLDSILFKENKRSMLDWAKRFNIICGIARGLLYLHQDSRFRIIHRDLKASNILLDKDMNPKISDFGMARIFGSDQTEANTKRVVGTYGYMSPEYAMDGLFSVKSDVFSFGVLVLEIVSGQKNRGFYQTNNQLNLLAYAWKLYREGRALELMDSSSGEDYQVSEVMRCIQVGLLCVQEHAEDRPNMSAVVLMLGSESVSMQQPKNPGYCLGRRSPSYVDNDHSSSNRLDETCSVNQVTVTILDGR